MKLTHDPKYNIAYLRLHEKTGPVVTIKVSDEMNVDMAPDGTVYGIELLNANEKKHDMKAHDRIEMNPEIMFGKPVIKGTRITVELILRKLGGGMTADEIIQDHPHLSVADIRAAQEFAADYLAEDEFAFG